MTKFYVIEESNTAFNDLNAASFFKCVAISTTPALHDSSKEECLQGWCGTTNEICVHAHGFFETFELAKEFVEEKFPKLSDAYENGERFESNDKNVVVLYQSFVDTDEELLGQ